MALSNKRKIYQHILGFILFKKKKVLFLEQILLTASFMMFDIYQGPFCRAVTNCNEFAAPVPSKRGMVIVQVGKIPILICACSKKEFFHYF